MLSGHPHIDRSYIRETVNPQGCRRQTLVVETSLVDPASGDIRNIKEWSRLYGYLDDLAVNDFGGFDTVHMHGRHT